MSERGISSLNQKKWKQPLKSANSNQSSYQISVYIDNFKFFDQICPKSYFRSKNEKVNITTEFCVFELVKVANFRLNWQFWFFGGNLLKKSIWSKLENGEQLTNCAYFKFLVPSFSFNDKICPKMAFPVKNRKSQQHHWITHTQISLGIKFQFKLAILIFWANLPKKVFPVKNWNNEHH